MDSQKIIEKLDVLHPDPPLLLDTKAHEPVHSALMSITMALKPTILLAAQRNILGEPSASWFAEDRKQRFGKSLEQVEQDEGGAKAWSAAQPGLEDLKAELSKHKRDDGPFILGGTVSYGDFCIAGFFEWVERADRALYKQICDYDESFTRHHEACQPWLMRDD